MATPCHAGKPPQRFPAAVRLVGFLKDGLSRYTVHGLQLPQWDVSDLEATQKYFDDLQVILRGTLW